MKCLVYADVNLNLSDGSSIWVQSVVEVLRSVYPDGRIVLLSREQMNGKGVSATLQKTAGIDIRICDQAGLQQARNEERGPPDRWPVTFFPSIGRSVLIALSCVEPKLPPGWRRFRRWHRGCGPICFSDLTPANWTA